MTSKPRGIASGLFLVARQLADTRKRSRSYRLRALCFALPAAPTPAALPTGIARRGAPTALKRKTEAIVVPAVARKQGFGRRLARDEATLGLIAQHRDKLGAIVGLGAQRLVRDDDRGSRQCSRSDAIDDL